MDPNETLRHMLELARRIQERDDALQVAAENQASLNIQVSHLEDQAEDGNRLAELTQALDSWLAKGGFRPNRWVGP